MQFLGRILFHFISSLKSQTMILSVDYLATPRGAQRSQSSGVVSLTLEAGAGTSRTRKPMASKSETSSVPKNWLSRAQEKAWRHVPKRAIWGVWALNI
jgi:hypothetical protein